MNGKRFWSRLSLRNFWNASPTWHVVLPVIAVVVLGVGAIALYLPGAMHAAAIDSAYRGNLEVADLIKITRGYYTRRVVVKAIETGRLTPSYEHENEIFAIPLPATFVKDISDLLKERDTSLTLISPYPWPHRADRKMDGFQTTAWEAFQKNPEAVFSRQEVRDGRRVLRVAVADRLTAQTCVDCHNGERKSPRRNWRLGDVRAVMEVTKVVEPYLAAAEQRGTVIIASIAGSSFVVVALLIAFAGAAARRTREKHETDQHLQYLAHHDAMTGTFNRTRFVALLDEAITRATEGVALHYIDLDRLKEINDKLGHALGDELLQSAAERLRSIAGRHDLLARLGGNEFVLAQTRLSSSSDATTCAGSIIYALSAPFDLQGHQVRVSASIGVVLRSLHNERAEDLIKSADIARYHAKATGGDRFTFFTPNMSDELNARRELEKTVRDAAENDGFDLHYQPVYGVKRGRYEGFEALLRLPRPTGGFIMPDVFIPIAEEIGLIAKIGAWVVRRACAVAATWPDDLTVAVNLSPEQFKTGTEENGSISEVVRRALTESGLAPHRLELELTEGVLLEITDAVIAEIHELRALGVALAIDDFGTGYSSLGYLWKLPFNKIKIDRSFVAASSDGDPTVGSIIKTIAALGRTLNMHLTAEGIETYEQAAAFAKLGCDQMQGYLFGRPMPETDLAAVILKNSRNDRKKPDVATSGAVSSRRPIRAMR